MEVNLFVAAMPIEYKSEIVILVTGMHTITSAFTPEAQLARPDAQPAHQASGFR